MPPSGDLRTVGDRIEAVLAELRSSLGIRDWELVEEAVGLITDLYGGGFERVVGIVSNDDLSRLVADELVASLLILHGLHPVGLEARVDAAIDSVRPYMESHGGDVVVLHIDEDAGVLHLRMMGSCDGCPSSSVTLQNAVRQALAESAPEIVQIEVVDETPPPAIAIGLSQKPVSTA